MISLPARQLIHPLLYPPRHTQYSQRQSGHSLSEVRARFIIVGRLTNDMSTFHFLCKTPAMASTAGRHVLEKVGSPSGPPEGVEGPHVVDTRRLSQSSGGAPLLSIPVNYLTTTTIIQPRYIDRRGSSRRLVPVLSQDLMTRGGAGRELVRYLITL